MRSYSYAGCSSRPIENFVSERGDFIFNSFRNFKPVKRFQNRSGSRLKTSDIGNSIRCITRVP